LVVNIHKGQGTMPTIRFETKLFKIDSWTILKLPESASTKLPSRGMCFVAGKMNGVGFKTPLEPDGSWIHYRNGSHWFRVDNKLQNAAGVQAGDGVKLEIEPIPNKDWPEPDVPKDLQKALANNQEARAVWDKTTPAARWDWIRSIRATNYAQTRQKRIEVAIDKLQSGKPRQCCFNRSACTEPYVSHNWILMEPRQAAE
jgi:hypothetical protein